MDLQDVSQIAKDQANKIIEQQLDEYAELVERQDLLQKQMQELLDKVPVPQEVIKQWDAIKAEFQPMIEIVTINAEAIKQQIQTQFSQFCS